MAIRNDKNIEALRIGIAEQERKRIQDEESERIMQKLFARHHVPADEIKLVPVIALLEGDRLVATDDGASFWVCGKVRRIDRFTEEGQRPAGDWWVTVDRHEAALGGASYGHAYDNDSNVLIYLNTTDAEKRRPETLRQREEERFKRTPGRTVSHEAPVAVAIV